MKKYIDEILAIWDFLLIVFAVIHLLIDNPNGKSWVWLLILCISSFLFVFRFNRVCNKRGL